jgi:hypothetical protein
MEHVMRDFITFGPVHLDVTDIERALVFWRDLVGLTDMGIVDGAAQLGAGEDVLIVLHPGAMEPVLPGFLGDSSGRAIGSAQPTTRCLTRSTSTTGTGSASRSRWKRLNASP